MLAQGCKKRSFGRHSSRSSEALGASLVVDLRFVEKDAGRIGARPPALNFLEQLPRGLGVNGLAVCPKDSHGLNVRRRGCSCAGARTADPSH